MDIFRITKLFVCWDGCRIFIHILNLLLACGIFYHCANCRHLHSTQYMDIKHKLRQFYNALILKIQLPFDDFFLTRIYNMLQWHARDSHECYKHLWEFEMVRVLSMTSFSCFLDFQIFPKHKPQTQKLVPWNLLLTVSKSNCFSKVFPLNSLYFLILYLFLRFS